MTGLVPRPGLAEQRASRSAAALMGVALLTASLNARSELVDIVWKHGDRFDRSLIVASGNFAKLCGSSVAGKAVTWSFDADVELNFNIHFQECKEVRYPSRTDRVSRSAGTLAVDLAQDHCWMWTTKSASAGKQTVRLVLK